MKKIFIFFMFIGLILFSGCGLKSDFYFLDANSTEIFESVQFYPNVTTTEYDNSTGDYLLTRVENTYIGNNSNTTHYIELDYNASGIAENITVVDLFGNTTMQITYNARGDIENVTYTKN